MATDLLFTEDEMAIEAGFGYPKAYAKLCRDRSFRPYGHGPPFTFTPYALPQQEGLRAKELDEMFPIVNSKAKATAKPRIFLSLLWKQLNHLGNAGFDPNLFRVDPYGNVLYYHADSASPLAWDIDHWFPCSRGGLTVPSNLRILQWQVCKNKDQKLEFLIPWWDFQLGISISQFLSIFASSNSDFRRRAFSMLFKEGESEELNASQTVDSHSFPSHFMESKEKIGLSPAAVVLTRREANDSFNTLKSLNINRRPRSNSPIIATRKLKPGMLKENENPETVGDPYRAIVVARDSLKRREETAKMNAEIERLDDEVNELQQKTEEEKVSIEELELVLIKRKRRAEKCRRLAESQSSYRAMLEKMIRDAMHQNVVYKEQVRLNQAASNALMARLEAQKAICDSSERELHRRFKQKDEIERQMRPEWERTRKRSRIEFDSFIEERRNENTDNKNLLCLPGIEIESRTPIHKELRVFLEEEQKASEEGLSLVEEREEIEGKSDLCNKEIVSGEEEKIIEEKLKKLNIEEEGKMYNVRFPAIREREIEEEDEESRKLRGKGHVEKWLELLLENSQDSVKDVNNPPMPDEIETSKTNEIIRKLNLTYPHKDLQNTKGESGNNEKMEREEIVEKELKNSVTNKQQKSDLKNDGGGEGKEEIAEIEEGNRLLLKNNPPPYKITRRKSNANEADHVGKGIGSSSSFDRKERKEKSGGKEKGLERSESARIFRSIPSSPSIILGGMKKRVDCIGKKPLVMDDDDCDNDQVEGNNFIKSSFRIIKKAVKM